MLVAIFGVVFLGERLTAPNWLGVALIARNNPHSLQAHVAGLGMAEVGDFEVNGNIFATVAFRVPPRAG